MNYNFDKLTERRGSNSVKWDECNDPETIPAWVADMDFEAAPCIMEALQKRVDHRIFGYTFVPDSYYKAITDWFSRKHDWDICRDWITYTSGVVPALSVSIKALTQPGDKVLIQTPVYNCFFSSIRNNGCEIVESPLVRTTDSYAIDFDDMERKVSDPTLKVFVLCNPHNPAGRVWTREELTRMNDICMRHGVRVISDEIHCELVMPGHTFLPFASLSDDCQNNSITLNSPSKAFNIAGLQIANIICKDPETRQRINRAININEVCDVNAFGVTALQAAYNEGEDWLNELLTYLHDNYCTLRDFFATHMPEWKVLRLEGTYLPWVDISSTGLTADEFTEQLLNASKVRVNSGMMYGQTTGKDYIRINIACPRARLMEILKRIETFYKQIEKNGKDL